MSTPVQDIYKIFLSQIGADLLSELDQEVAEDLMLTYLEGSTVEFDICRKDLSIVDGCFIDNLELDEKYILAKGMILYWLQPKINREETLKVAVTDSDYNKKSTAPLLDKLIKLWEKTENDLRKRKNKYSWKGKSVNE